MTLALACRLNPSPRSIRATVRSDTRCPAPASASARLRVDLVVHTNGEVGSPRVSRVDQRLQRRREPRVGLGGRLATTPGRPHPPRRLRAALQFPNPLGHRVGMHPGRHGHHRDPAPTQLGGLRRQHQPTLPLVQMRT